MWNKEKQLRINSIKAFGVEKLSDIIPNPAIDFKVGDKVMYRNPYGIMFGPLTIFAISKCNELWKYGNCIYLDKESYWFPVTPESLTPIKPQ